LLSYTTPKAKKVNTNNEATILNNIPNPQDKGMTNCNINMCTSQDLEISSILYRDYQLAELNSWNGEAYPLFLFENTDFLEIDSKNILTLLL